MKSVLSILFFNFALLCAFPIFAQPPRLLTDPAERKQASDMIAFSVDTAPSTIRIGLFAATERETREAFDKWVESLLKEHPVQFSQLFGANQGSKDLNIRRYVQGLVYDRLTFDIQGDYERYDQLMKNEAPDLYKK